MDDANPRAVMGANKPPLDQPEELEPRLKRDHAEIIAECAQAELDRFALAEAPATDEECAAITDFVANLKGLSRRLDKVREEEGRPYLEGKRKIDGFFGAFVDEIDKQTNPRTGVLTKRIGIYNAAKAEREAAERREKERIERERAEAQRAEEERLRKEAEARQREADEAAARIRQAESAEEREGAAAKLREAETAAAEAREGAESAAEAAAKAERKADTQSRAAEGNLANRSRISSGAATSSVTKEWTHAITDAGLLLKSLGPLGPFISNTEISDAIGRAVREHARAGTMEQLTIPGVRFFEQNKTNIRATRAR